MSRTIFSKTFGKHKMRHTVTPISRLTKYSEPNVLPMVGDNLYRHSNWQVRQKALYEAALAASRVNHSVSGQAP